MAEGDRHSTVAQLKDDIDSGRTGDKVANADPGLSPLGTDDEAGGNAMTPDQIDIARKTEAKTFAPVADTRPGGWVSWLIPGLVGLLVLALAAFYVLHRS